MNKEDIEELKREIKALKQANIEYKDRIDKVIDYIENDYDNYYGDELYEPLQEIINILKGGNNE